MIVMVIIIIIIKNNYNLHFLLFHSSLSCVYYVGTHMRTIR
jgi:hypothetical protein